MGLMNSIVSIGSVVLQSAVNQLGEITIAAHTAARKIVEMLMQPMISIAIANTTFVSQNLGAKQFTRIRTGQRKCVLLCTVWVVLVIVISFTCIDALLSLLVNAEGNTGYATCETLFKNQQFILFCLGYFIHLSKWIAGTWQWKNTHSFQLY